MDKKKEPEEAEKIKDSQENIDKKAEEYLDGWKRCQADFENYKKREAERQKGIITYLNVNLVAQILPVLDSFHASTDHIPEDQKNSPWVAGIMHIQKQLEKVLEDNGISEIPVKVGDKFNPEIHEAIRQEERINPPAGEAGNKEESEEKKECKNIIKKVMQKGYKMGERVIRAARVIVE